MHDKFMWNLTENMNERVAVANGMELQGVKSKF